MAAELTKMYRTADGRVFEKADRDVARAHDAWLDLVAWVNSNMPIDDGDQAPQKLDQDMAHHMATDPELLAILKRKPTEAPPL